MNSAALLLLALLILCCSLSLFLARFFALVISIIAEHTNHRMI